MERERTDRQATLTQQQQARTRERVRADVDALGLLTPGDLVEESLTADNALLLGSGEHLVTAFSVAGTTILGLPGATIATACTFSADTATVLGVTFNGPDTTAAMVTIGANARINFIGCRFRRGGRATGAYVSVTAGGRATFTGCTFDGTAAAGSLVNNAGALADVNVGFCRNATALAHVNVTLGFNI